MMQHFLSTRFNLAVYQRQANDGDRFTNLFNRGVRVSPDVWMENRLNLFERYCLPSIVNQTSKAFTWVIFVDPETPKQFLDRFTQMQANMPSIKMVVRACDGNCQREFTYRKALESYIRAHLVQATKRIITTRFDADDLLDKDFIKVIRLTAAAARLPARLPARGIDYMWGYYLRLADKRLHIKKYQRNQFSSLVENMEDSRRIRTVWAVQHGSLAQLGPVTYLGTADTPGWVTLIHGSKFETGNAGNVLCGQRTTQTDEYMKTHFGIGNCNTNRNGGQTNAMD